MEISQTLQEEKSFSPYSSVWKRLLSYYLISSSLAVSCIGKRWKANRNIYKKSPVYFFLWPVIMTLLHPSSSVLQAEQAKFSRTILAALCWASSCSSLYCTGKPKARNSFLVIIPVFPIMKSASLVVQPSQLDSFSALRYTADSCSACPEGPFLWSCFLYFTVSMDCCTGLFCPTCRMLYFCLLYFTRLLSVSSAIWDPSKGVVYCWAYWILPRLLPSASLLMVFPLSQVINKDIRQYCPQYQLLWNSTGNKPLVTFQTRACAHLHFKRKLPKCCCHSNIVGEIYSWCY